ncbi:MAG: InlB B-repeat-containing protein [Pseudobutyrivibrio sp.]|uniref:C1 family peptidase n=1 Tax=Pseudobutyrivibrio sp. TaxID=2014367 RepID=UPI0025E7E16D|nr:C1 family peptidase [Pseudobutyrivibrio sp.]MBQ6462047.1 InlB B-repeat-containing protein [Pseudobutyrivibrio sp.]
MKLVNRLISLILSGALAFTAFDTTALAESIDATILQESTSEESNQSDGIKNPEETPNDNQLNTNEADEDKATAEEATEEAKEEPKEAVTDEILEEEAVEDEVLEEETLEDELLKASAEEDEEEEIIKFKELDEITTHYKLALDSLKEKFPKKIIAYTNQDNEIEIRIYEWTPIDDYDEYLGDYTFEPVVDTDYTIAKDVEIPTLYVHVEDESDGPTGLITTDDSYEIPIYNDGISQSMLLRSAASTDSKYNGYEEGYLPEIRSQGSEGACWAFAAIGAVETDLIKNSGESSSIDLSELQLAYFTAHKYTDPKGCHNSDEYEYLGSNYLSNGGTATMANQALANKVGPVQEVYVPYSKGSNYVPAEEYALGHDYAQVQNIYEINIEDRAQVKKAILEHGSVSTSFYASDDGAYSSTYNSYYTATEDQNHAVMLVGWDDNFSRDNFMDGNKPLGNGAWLVRNSWNLDDYGKNGYFWLSYYDKSLLDGGEAIAYTVTKDMYDNVYSYASSEYTGAIRSTNKGGSLTAKVEYDGKIAVGEQIEAVGVQVLNTNATIQVTVSDGTNSTTGTYHNAFYGYYTIPLDEPLEVTEPGKKITLTYKITAPSNEGAAIAYDSTAFNHLGNIYHTVYNDAGFTIGTEKYKEDAKVKLYTKNTGNVTPTGNFETSTPSFYDHAETTHQIEATFDGTPVNPEVVNWAVVNDDIASVDATGLVTIKRAKGSTVVFGDYTVAGETYRITVNVTVKPYTIDYVIPEGVSYRKLYTTYYPGVADYCKLPGNTDISKDGYALRGWKKGSGEDDEDVTESDLKNILAENLTLYPALTRYAIKLSYYMPDGMGGYGSEKIYIASIQNKDTPYALPAAEEVAQNPLVNTPEGKVFYGWSSDRDGNKIVTTIGSEVFQAEKNIYTGKYSTKEELVFYPQFKEANQWVLTYDANGGTSSDVKKLVTENQTYGDLPLPKREGYVFLGWHLNKENGPLINKDSIVTTDSDHTVVAKWGQLKYKITNGTDEAAVDNADEIVYLGEDIRIYDIKLIIDGVTYNEYIKDSEGNDTNERNFYVDTTGTYSVGNATVLLTLTGSLLSQKYANHTIVKNISILKDVETVSAPVGNNESTLEYGDLVKLSTETAGATIYVKVLTGDTTEALPQSDSEKAAFESAATRYTTFRANYEGEFTVRALAVKTIDNNITYSDCVDIPFTVVSSWGDVNTDDTSVDNPRNLPKGLWISDKTMATITDAKTHSGTVYSGYAKTLPTGKNSNGVNYSADYRVFYNNKLLTYGADYTISYKNNKNAGDNANIIINGKGKYVSSYIQEFSITPMPVDDGMLSIAASGATPVDGVSFVVTENKKLQKPKLTISYTQDQYASFNATASKPVVRKLTEGKDFQADYSNVKADPTDAGYSIPVTIKGNYTGTIAARKLRVIDASRRITNAKVTINANAVVLDGTDKKSEVNTTVTMKGTPLTEGTDYTITYTYNSKIPGYQPGEGVFSVGSYTATITGIGTYMGTMTKNFSVPAKAATKISAKTITVDCDKAVYKYADKIAFMVVDGDRELKQDKDYVVANVNSEKVGMSKATIYGIGAYTGSRTKAYTVEGTIITKDDVSYKDGVDSFTYTGAAETSSPNLIVTLKNPADSNATVSKTIEYGTSSFTVPGYDESYQVTWPKDAVNVGTKSIKIKGTNGNATGLTLTYKVTKADITDAVVYLDADKTAKLKVNDEDELRELPYTNAAPVIHFEFAGKDYYSNQSFGKANATFAFKGGYKFGNTVTATITGKKNFTGKMTGTFKIGTAYIDDNTITVGDIIAGNKFKAPSVKVISKAGKTLAAGINKDYTVEYLYNGNDDVHSRYESVNFNEKVESGTEYIARIKGSCNGYKGDKDIVFRAIDKSYDISKAKVSLNRRFLFDGRETLVSNDDITLVLNKEVVEADGFEIISTTLPRNKAGQLIAGNGKLRLHGVGAYAGYKDVTIPIEKAPVDYAITFKADRTATDGTYLNIANKPATIRNKTGVFTLPSTGYSATSTRKVGSKYVTTKYILSYYYLENDESVKFAGTDSNGVTEINLRDLGFTMSQPVTIVAKFEKNVDATYKVTYNPGQYSTAGKAVSKTIKRGASYKIVKQTTFKRKGYKFEGWATTDGASTADINFAPGKTIINAKPAGGELKLYPVWKKLE